MKTMQINFLNNFIKKSPTLKRQGDDILIQLEREHKAYQNRLNNYESLGLPVKRDNANNGFISDCLRLIGVLPFERPQKIGKIK